MWYNNICTGNIKILYDSNMEYMIIYMTKSLVFAGNYTNTNDCMIVSNFNQNYMVRNTYTYIKLSETYNITIIINNTIPT